MGLFWISKQNKGGQDMSYELNELASQNDSGKRDMDYIRQFLIMPYMVVQDETKKVSVENQKADGFDSKAAVEPISGLNSEQNHATLTKEQLMLLCIDKDVVIASCVKSLKENPHKMLGKKDIMELYHCESNKALRILKLMFQMGYGNKIGKEYYVSWKAHEDFVKDMVGKEVYI